MMKRWLAILVLVLVCGVVSAQTVTNIGHVPRPWAPRNGLVGWWPLNDATGSAARNNLSSTPGALAGNATWAAGKFGTNLSLDGADDYVDSGARTILNGAAAASVSVWVKATRGNYGAYQNILDNNDGTQLFSLRIDETYGDIRLLIGKTYAYGPAAIGHNAWVHIAGVYNGSQMIVYRNGVAGTPVNKTGAIGNNTTKNIVFGINGSGLDTQEFTGLIADCRLYNRALSAAEVAEIYQRGK